MNGLFATGTLFTKIAQARLTKRHTLRTDTLRIVPLSARQLALWCDDLSTLEKELDVRYNAEFTDALLPILRAQIAPTRASGRSYRWHTFWWIVRATDSTVVGSADFKNAPDADGCVEIGYGLGNGHCGHGYMTQTVRAMCAWALAQDGVQHVIAETERDNAPSQQVLRRCGFEPYKEGQTLWWRL